jgi:hypothetical protein
MKIVSQISYVLITLSIILLFAFSFAQDSANLVSESHPTDAQLDQLEVLRGDFDPFN